MPRSWSFAPVFTSFGQIRIEGSSSGAIDSGLELWVTPTAAPFGNQSPGFARVKIAMFDVGADGGPEQRILVEIIFRTKSEFSLLVGWCQEPAGAWTKA